MDSEEQKQFNHDVIGKQQQLLAREEWHSCANCTHLRYQGQTPVCDLFSAAPPLPVLIVGCPEWTGKTPF
jgi:hypothetical protein